MDFDVVSRTMQIQGLPLNIHKYMSTAQLCLRFFATVASLSAACITFTNHQSVFGLRFEARYSYSSTFRYFGYANLIVSIISAISLIVADYLGRNGSNPKSYFYMFLFDLVTMILSISGCSSATAVGLIADNGNAHSGWLPICNHVSEYCNKFVTSIALSYFSFLHFLTLTIMSAYLSRDIHQVYSS